jgi:hypothetical protein
MTLVAAATAPVGRSIVDQLPDAGCAVRALTRDAPDAGLPPEAAPAFLAAAVICRPPRSLEQSAADHPVGS